MMDTPNKNAKTYDEVLQQSIEEDWGFAPTRCPHCQNGAVGYGNEDRQGNRVEDGITVCSCDVCGREWWVDDIEIPDGSWNGHDPRSGGEE